MVLALLTPKRTQNNEKKYRKKARKEHARILPNFMKTEKKERGKWSQQNRQHASDH